MRLSTIQRKLLIALVSSLILAAGIAITGVLFGDLGETTGRILATTMSLAAFTITGMAASVPPKGGRAGTLATVGLVASGVTFLFTTYFIWGEPEFEEKTFNLAKVTAITAIVAVACAHAALLLRGRGRGAATDNVVTGALICTSLFSAILIVAIIIEEWPEALGRLLGALAILAVLGTLLTPLLPKITNLTRSDND